MNRFNESFNSQVEFYLGLACSMLRSSHVLPSYDSSAMEADVRACMAGVEIHGLDYLTKVLPEIGKALDSGLETGRFICPPRVKRSKGSFIPLFLGSVICQIFSHTDGSLLPDANPLALKHARQICFCFYKLETGYSRKLEEKVLETFVNNDEDNLLEGDSRLSSPLVKEARYLLENLLETFDPLTAPFKHGPGAVATGEVDEEKWTFNRVYAHLDTYFPFHETFMVGASEIADRRDSGTELSFYDEAYAKVILVPKDSRGPRIISCEPLEIQYVQQSLGQSLMTWLEAHFLTSGRLNFTNQLVNRKLALESSLTRGWATLDLKDASDMVSLALVEALLGFSPALPLWLAARSRGTTLPNGKTIVLKKFAPMGSALCFPVESMVFWAISVSAIAEQLRLTLPRVDLAMRLVMARKMVYVYGDDIVVKTENSLCVMDALELVGLRVNRHKSFINGHFRESCGLDAFKGVEVTPTRIKCPWTGAESDARAYASYVSYANSLQAKGFGDAACFLWASLAAAYGEVPYGLSNSSFPCRIVGSRTEARFCNRSIGVETRWYRKTQVEQIRAHVLEPASRQRVDDGWGRLLSNLTRLDSPSLHENWATYWDIDDRGEITAFRDRLDRRKIVSRRSINLKRRWTSV